MHNDYTSGAAGNARREYCIRLRNITIVLIYTSE